MRRNGVYFQVKSGRCARISCRGAALRLPGGFITSDKIRALEWRAASGSAVAKPPAACGLPALDIESSRAFGFFGVPAAIRAPAAPFPGGRLSRQIAGKEVILIRKLPSGEYRLYSRKVDPRTGKRRNLGTFRTRADAEKHERAVQFFKRRG